MHDSTASDLSQRLWKGVTNMETFELPETQVRMLIIMLRMELRSGMRMSRGETALQAFVRLTGINPGRGDKGRQKALDILSTGVDDE